MMSNVAIVDNALDFHHVHLYTRHESLCGIEARRGQWSSLALPMSTAHVHGCYVDTSQAPNVVSLYCCRSRGN